MPETMRAAVLYGPGQARLEEVPRPDPGPGEVRVRLEGCGVCGSNLPVWEGRDWFSYPLEPGAPGHEGWGRVDALGAGVRRVAEGDRVALLSHRAFADYDLAPADSVVRLPAALDDLPFPAEPIGCAMNVFRRSGIGPGDDVAVVGVGFLGALLIRLAAHAGARVIGLSRRRFAREVALRLGAVEALSADDPEAAAAHVEDATRGAGCAVVIEATGHQAPLDLASRLVRVRGRLVIAGYHQDGTRTVDLQLWNWRGLDVVNAHERDPAEYGRGMEAAVEAVAAGVLDPAPLLTHHYPLSELPAALDVLRERPPEFLKAVALA